MKKNKKISRKMIQSPAELSEVLGLDQSIGLEWQVRREVLMQIIEAASNQDLKVSWIALRAKTSRARVTRILKEDIQGISLDVLFRVLGVCGKSVSLRFSKSA